MTSVTPRNFRLNRGSNSALSNRHQAQHLPSPPTPINYVDDMQLCNYNTIGSHHYSLAAQQTITFTHRNNQSPIPRHDSGLAQPFEADSLSQAWPMFQSQFNNMGGLAAGAASNTGVKRSRDHERTPSTSTVASNGPASPFMQNTVFPQIANADHSPYSAAQFADQAAAFSKNFPTPSQTPTDSVFGTASRQSGNLASAHMAMKDFAMDHHNSHVEEISDDLAPSRQSTSSYGNDSPATPQSGNGEIDTRTQSMSATDHRNPIQLHRTESQVYQDELYNPNIIYTSAPATKSSATFLSPHRNLISERLQTANLARSTSPSTAFSRERSPFRQQTSPYASLQEWKPTPNQVGTAANVRQQQKEEAEQAELARQMPRLHREPTKTISPKDALLDYNQESDAPLFPESFPMGYKQHFGGTEQWSNNTFGNQQTHTFHGLPSTGHHGLTFPNANSAEQSFVPDLDFALLPQQSEQMNHNLLHMGYQNLSDGANAKMSLVDQTPDFPPALPSMESSVSDLGPGPSSQESLDSTTPQRPDDVRANTGTYTCTYHGCTQRFDSHTSLQHHKRDFHRSQQQRDSTSASVASSTSPRSPGSPDESGSGMTSAAILARNSQAGPHKCARINPSTGKPCNTIFSRPYDLTRHEDTIHNNRKQKVRCPLCREEKTFSRNDALTRHMRVVHPEVEAYGKRGRRGD